MQPVRVLVFYTRAPALRAVATSTRTLRFGGSQNGKAKSPLAYFPFHCVLYSELLIGK